MAMRTEEREVREGLVSGEDGREEEVRSGRPQRVEEKKCRKCGGAKPEVRLVATDSSRGAKS